ncbi:MAG: hypothetical protein KAH97_08615, partial [Anaerolineales bacterium]|nr:hypothetical protein [Anaerolineales bacterium]
MDFPSKGFIDADTRREVNSGHSQFGDGFDQDSKGETNPLLSDSNRSDKPKMSPELESAYKQTERALQRLLSAAIAFCDGAISAGQMRAVRELLREQELRLARLEGQYTPPFVTETPPPLPDSDPEIIQVPPLSQISEEPEMPVMPESDELSDMLTSLDQKIAQLEDDHKQDRINAAQYRAIRRHYKEQREVALRLRQAHPDSERWKVVLKEGKTTFLLQLNEAAVRCVAFYDLKSRKLIFTQGEIPDEA